jgi:hypothetical protein
VKASVSKGGQGRIRTFYLLINSQPLHPYELLVLSSTIALAKVDFIFFEPTARIELATRCLQGSRSDLLSYVGIFYFLH